MATSSEVVFFTYRDMKRTWKEIGSDALEIFMFAIDFLVIPKATVCGSLLVSLLLLFSPTPVKQEMVELCSNWDEFEAQLALRDEFEFLTSQAKKDEIVADISNTAPSWTLRCMMLYVITTPSTEMNKIHEKLRSFGLSSKAINYIQRWFVCVCKKYKATSPKYMKIKQYVQQSFERDFPRCE